MRHWLVGLVVICAAHAPLFGQTPKPLPVVFEGVVGVAQLVESFSDNCCGPSRDATGLGLGVRVRERSGRLFELGLDAGATLAGRREMKWALVVLSIAAPRRVAPWVHVGGGLVAQPGECPQDGPDSGPGCETDLKLGATAAGGVRWTIRPRLAIGIEAAWVRGKPSGSTSFTTRRVGITLRIQ